MEEKNKFMLRAIELSKKAAFEEKSGGAFGAVIVKDNQIIAEGYNQVLRHSDSTWHAEMEAIRTACKVLGTPHLEGCALYTSAECCPMCLSAAYWARIDKIYYAATTKDALKYGNFADINILDELRKEPKARRLKSQQICHDEATKVWLEFSRIDERPHY